MLKDAAATAIYGSRGSNGVVLITTKRGLAGRTTVNFNSYVGTQSAARRLPLLNSQQYLEYFRESAANDGYDPDETYGVPGVDDQANADWQDGVLRSAPVSNAELSVSGGDERLRYRLSGTWFDQNGIVIHSGYRRAGGRLNLDFNPVSRLSFSTSLAFSGDHDDRVENDGSDKGIITDAVGNSPLIPIRDSTGAFTGPPDLEYLNPVALATPQRRPGPHQQPGRQRRGAAPDHRPAAVHQPVRDRRRERARGPVRVSPGGGVVRLECGRRGQERLHPGQPLRDRQLRHPVAQPGRPVRPRP